MSALASAPALRSALGSACRVSSTLLSGELTRSLTSPAAARSLRREVFKFGGSSVGSPEAFRNVAGVLLAGKDAGLQ